MFSFAIIESALELGCIYALVAMALYLSFRVLNIADMTTDGAFTLGCAVSATAAVGGHPVLGLLLYRFRDRTLSDAERARRILGGRAAPAKGETGPEGEG